MIRHNSFGGYDSGYARGYNNASKDMRTIIEDIKAEIKSELITDGQVIEGEYFSDDAENINFGLNKALEIIDKHIGKAESEDT